MMKQTRVILCLFVISIFVAGVINAAEKLITMDYISDDFIYKGFQKPDKQYGPVPLWWWDGEHLSKDRLTWQLETLKKGGVPAVCFIQKYPYGPPTGPEAGYFSEEWWDYMVYVAQECNRLDMDLWVHDETYHRPRKRYWQTLIEKQIEKHPEYQGYVLDVVHKSISGQQTVKLDWPANFTLLSIAAYPQSATGSLDCKNQINLTKFLKNNSIEWQAPDGEWLVGAIGYKPDGLCRTTRAVVDKYIQIHYEEYRKRLGDLFNQVLVGTFQDEMYILNGKIPCDVSLLNEFKKQKGYKDISELIGLFKDIGEKTEKIRCDYYDIVVQMLEKNWFKPIYYWHEKNDLKISHDNWGRNDIARQVTQYADYFRTMSWYQAPGYDDGGKSGGIGTRNLFDAKLAASIAACYNRPRVWCEAFHTTGWGLKPETQMAMAIENYCYGANLYDKHGLYYTTLGGWYEHAPPDVHFRQPYWHDARILNDAISRLSFLFSQGTPVVDAAFLFPVTSIHANWLADNSINEQGRYISEVNRILAFNFYQNNLDFFFVDNSSVLNADIEKSFLKFASFKVPVFIIGPNSTTSRRVLEKVHELYKNGGIVVAIGQLPVISTEHGRHDPRVKHILKDIFGTITEKPEKMIAHKNSFNGVGLFVQNSEQLLNYIKNNLKCDVKISEPGIYYTHRKIGNRDVYLLLNIQNEKRHISFHFKAKGQPQLWDVFTGQVKQFYHYDYNAPYTNLSLDFDAYESYVLVIDNKSPHNINVDFNKNVVENLTTLEKSATLKGWLTGSGAPVAKVQYQGELYTGKSDSPRKPLTITLDNTWDFKMIPTMNNKWGDFRYPASEDKIGVEIRQFLLRKESVRENGLTLGWQNEHIDPDNWHTVNWSYGPYFWLRTNVNISEPPDPPTETSQRRWQPYVFSTLFGKPGTHPDDHGFNSIVSNNYIISPKGTGLNYFWTTLNIKLKEDIFCYYGEGIQQIWINDREMLADKELKKGYFQINLEMPAEVMVAVKPDLKTFLVFQKSKQSKSDSDMNFIPRLKWFHKSEALNFDYLPWKEKSPEWFRFFLPPGSKQFTCPVKGQTRMWIDGVEKNITKEGILLEPINKKRSVALRLEPERGCYEGAAWTGPVKVLCQSADITLGDWRDKGYQCFSGVGHYQQNFKLISWQPGDRVILDLGQVFVTAAVKVNGKNVGTRIARPFVFDISNAVKSSDNTLEINVANTIANHFEKEVPTRYIFPGQTDSGLYGPVKIRIEPAVSISLKPQQKVP